MNIKSVKDMTLDEKVGQLILAGFHSYDVDEHINDIVKKDKIGNIILFTRNFQDAKQMYTLNKHLHELIYNETGIIPFIAIDQEGGLVTRMMKDVTFAPGPMTCSASAKNASYFTGKMLAEDMIKLGINFNLAPSLDVNNNPANPVINVRSYSDDPKVVAELGHGFIEGSKEYGVLSCAKHFPGHGDCAVDSHLGLPTINYDLERIHNIEMYPFMHNLDVPAIMSAHIMFPKLDNVPATLSKKIITGVLREEIGYKGLILSDCLEMKAIKDNYGSSKGALMAILAGVDIVCISHTKEYQEEAVKLIKEAVLDNTLPMDVLDAKVERILKYKKSTMEYLDKYFYNTDKVPTFSNENKKLAQTIVDNSLTMVKGDLPYITENSLVIAPVATAKTIIEDEFDDRNLAKVLSSAYPLVDIKEYVQNDEFKQDILNNLDKYTNVIMFSYNAAVNKEQVAFINDLLKSNKEVFVISLKGPMDYHLYNNLNNYMCLYEYTPNSIRTVVKFFRGEITPIGSLPIKL